jgi:hypothetical protein
VEKLFFPFPYQYILQKRKKTERGALRPVRLIMPAFLIALSCVSCARNDNQRKVSFPPAPVLTVRSTWAVVTSPLLRLREEPTNKGTVLSHIRMGAVVEVIAKSDKEETIEEQTGYWYRINYEGLKGWVFGTYLEVFDSRSKADTFAEKQK